MDRREMLGMVGAGAFGLAATGATTAHADDDHDDKKHDHDDKKHDHDDKKHDHGHKHDHDKHIEVMTHCASVCAEAACHCLDMLKKGGDKAAKHANALAHVASCEAFCMHSASQTAYHSPLAHLAHSANAKACDECARACEGLEAEIMKKCVESCRKCAEVCRSMGHEDHG